MIAEGLFSAEFTVIGRMEGKYFIINSAVCFLQNNHWIVSP